VATSPAYSETQARILDAAERLFAERGFAATSLRRIAESAAVNLAAAHYHFGSKRELFLAVLTRRVDPMNRERLDRLDALERSSHGEPELERIVEAFIGPALRLRHACPGGADTVRLIGHAFSLPDSSLRQALMARFQEVFERYADAVRRAVPAIDEQESIWRFLFMIGALAYTMALCDDVAHLSGGRCDAGDVDGTLRRLVAFAAAGLRSAPPGAVGEV